MHKICSILSALQVQTRWPQSCKSVYDSRGLKDIEFEMTKGLIKLQFMALNIKI